MIQIHSQNEIEHHEFRHPAPAADGLSGSFNSCKPFVDNYPAFS